MRLTVLMLLTEPAPSFVSSKIHPGPLRMAFLLRWGWGQGLQH